MYVVSLPTLGRVHLLSGYHDNHGDDDLHHHRHLHDDQDVLWVVAPADPSLAAIIFDQLKLL